MPNDLESLQDVCEEVTKADVVLELLSDDSLSVSVHWPQTQGEDGDYCYGQGTILNEARKVLAALRGEGWEQCEFGGRKNFGHSGGNVHFAVRRPA